MLLTKLNLNWEVKMYFPMLITRPAQKRIEAEKVSITVLKKLAN